MVSDSIGISFFSFVFSFDVWLCALEMESWVYLFPFLLLLVEGFTGARGWP